MQCLDHDAVRAHNPVSTIGDEVESEQGIVFVVALPSVRRNNKLLDKQPKVRVRFDRSAVVSLSEQA